MSKILLSIGGVLLLLAPQVLFSQGLSLAVTPTLFEMSAEPYQAWNSSIKVINNNKHELTVYADVVNFAPQGETGHGKFLPVFEDFTEGNTLAEWVAVTDEAIVIQPESSKTIPIRVNIPGDASPGGHFAAILIGTKPPKEEEAFKISTSQTVTSLFFVRIDGDVIENGVVRAFRAEDTLLQEPEATFELRFENKGNVHLQPQGEIVISNMWGKERGIVPINQQSHFGNVLPESIRKFEFTWKGEFSFADIGRYKAVLTLGYGQDVKKFDTQSTFFWVIPFKPVALVLGMLIAIIWFVTWAIKSYVRRMLAISGVDAYVPPSQRRHVVHRGDVLVSERPSVQAPIKAGVSDLKHTLQRTKAFSDTFIGLADLAFQYKKFIISIVATVVSCYLIFFFFADVFTDQRDYEITIENPDAEIILSSEEIIHNKDSEIAALPAAIEDVETIEQEYTLILINSSDTPGVASALQKELAPLGYIVAELKSDFGESKSRTVIVYDVALQKEALALSKQLNGALLSARPEGEQALDSGIAIYIGNDYTF